MEGMKVVWTKETDDEMTELRTGNESGVIRVSG